MFHSALPPILLKSFLLSGLISLTLWQGSTSSASAQNQLHWNGASGATWNNADNWIYVPGPTPSIIPNSTTVAYFNNPGPGNVVIGNLGTDQSAQGLIFEDLTAPFTIGDLSEAFTLTIGASGIIISDTGAGGTPVTTAAATVNSNLVISTAQTWFNQSNQVFTAAGNLSLGANLAFNDDSGNPALNPGGSFVLGSAGKVIQQTGGNRVITVNDLGADTELTINGELALTESATTGRRLSINTAANASVIINANITNGAGGASGLTKQGAGTMTITGNISYTSGTGTVVDGGILNIDGGVATAGAAFNVNNGATLNLNATSYTGTGAWNIANGTFNVNTVPTTLTVSTITLGQDITPSPLAALNISNAYTLNLTSGVVVKRLTSAATLDANLSLSANRTFEVWDNAVAQDLIINGNIADGATAGGFTKTRAGTLAIRGTNTTTGENFLGQGKIVLDYTTNNTSKLGSGTQNLGGVDVSFVGNASAPTIQQVSSLTVFARGANNLSFTPGAGQNFTLQAGSIVRGAADGGLGGTLNFQLPASGVTIQTSNADTSLIGGWATIQDSQTAYFAAVSGGQVVKSISSSPNDLLSRQWASTLTNQNVTDDAGFQGVTDYMSISSLRFAGANALNVLENLHIASGGILVAQNSTSTGIFGGTITSGLIPGTLGSELIITQLSNQAFEIQSNIRRAGDTAGGAVNITKSGTGTLILSGNNQTSGLTNATTSSGNLFINEGTVVLKGGNAISDNTAVIFDPRFNAVLRLEDSETIGNLSSNGVSLDGEGTVDVDDNTLTVKQSGAQTYSGALTGSGTIIKDNLDPSANSIATWTLNTTANSGFTGDLQINRGIVTLAGNGVQNLGGVQEVRINQGGGLIIDHTDASTVLNRLNNNVVITLNGANARGSASTAIRGLNIRTNQGNTQIEVIKDLIINSGANYATLEAVSTNSGSATVIQATNSIVRNGSATLSVRGTNLGGPGTVGRTRLRLASNTAAAVAFANQFRTGGVYANGANVLATTGAAGNGAATAKDISIVPWAIGETFNASTPPATSDGNSFVAYNSDDLGFTPLHLLNQYSTYSAAAATHNVRESLLADLELGTGKNVNSLLINNENATATPITLTGNAGAKLSVTSGAFLFTGVGAANATTGLATQNAIQGGIVIRGFDGIEVSGPNKEYIMFANNMSTAGVTIESNLTSIARFTKSGQGLLYLKGDNSTLTDSTLNEGTLRIDNINNIGGNDGTLFLAGGTLQLSTDWDTATSGSFLSRTIHVMENTVSSLNTNASTVSDTTNDLTIGAITGSGTFIKQGLGTLTLGGSTASTFTGLFVVEGAAGTLQDGASVILNNTGGNAIAGDIVIGRLGSSPVGRSVLRLGRSDQIADTSVITISSAAGNNGFFNLNGYSETVAGIVNTNREGVIQVTQTAAPEGGLNSLLTLAGTGTYYYDGYLRNGAGGTGILAVSKTGSGTQTFSGDRIGYTGSTTISGGLLRLRDATAFASAVTNDADLELESTVAAWNFARVISGTGNVRKAGTGLTTLTLANTYSGTTDINEGTLALGTTGSINESRAINIKNGATFDVSAKGASGYSFGHIVSGGGSVTGSLNLIAGGSLRPGASTGPNLDATTGNQLGALAINGNLSLTGGSITGSGIGGGAFMQIATATLNDAGIVTAYAGGQAALSSYLGTNATTWNSANYYDANGVPNHDYVDVEGTFTWDTGSTISYASAFGYIPTAGDVLNLWDWTSLGGTYNLGADANFQRGGGLLGDLELPDISGVIYDLSLFQSHGIAVVVMVPEPSRALLLMAGLTTPFFLRRRRRPGLVTVS